jgi:hypothetical protein
VTSIIIAPALFLVLWTVGIEAERSSASPPRRPSTWYEYVLRKFNKTDFNYGAWIEERRRTLLDATASSFYFWYSFTMTAICMLLSAAYAKHRYDNKKIIGVACEFLADVYNDDLLAREQADAMTAKYNRHIEACNRAIEAAENEGWKQSTNPELEEAKSEIARLRQLLDEKISEHKRVSDELREKSDTLAQYLCGWTRCPGGSKEPPSSINQRANAIPIKSSSPVSTPWNNNSVRNKKRTKDSKASRKIPLTIGGTGSPVEFRFTFDHASHDQIFRQSLVTPYWQRLE